MAGAIPQDKLIAERSQSQLRCDRDFFLNLAATTRFDRLDVPVRGVAAARPSGFSSCRRAARRKRRRRRRGRSTCPCRPSRRRHRSSPCRWPPAPRSPTPVSARPTWKRGRRRRTCLLRYCRAGRPRSSAGPNSSRHVALNTLYKALSLSFHHLENFSRIFTRKSSNLVCESLSGVLSVTATTEHHAAVQPAASFTLALRWSIFSPVPLVRPSVRPRPFPRSVRPSAPRTLSHT